MAVGVILAGGEGRRIGGNKHDVLLAGRPLIGHVIDRLAPQVSALALGGADHALERWGYTILADAPDLSGPAAGLKAALAWAQPKAEDLIIVPCDMPFLPPTLGAMLAEDAVTVPLLADRPLWAVSVWPRTLVAKGLAHFGRWAGPSAPSLRSVMKGVALKTVPAPDASAFLGINTPEELDAAERQLEMAQC